MKTYTLITLMGNADLKEIKDITKENIEAKIEEMKTGKKVRKKTGKKKEEKGHGPLLNILLKIFESNEDYNIDKIVFIKEEKRINEKFKDEYEYKNGFNALKLICKKLNIKLETVEFSEDKKIIDYNDLYDTLHLIFEKFNLKNVLINSTSGTGQWKTVAMMFLDSSKNIFMIDVKHKEEKIEINSDDKFKRLMEHLKTRILKYTFNDEYTDSELVFNGIEKEKNKIDFFIKIVNQYLNDLKENEEKYSFDYPLLITGDTGTGKSELVNYIEKNLGTKSSFIKFNIAGLTESIIESELFGHVKGAFTGAVSDKTGLIKKADNGILFMDEIGDLSKSMQVKLLRVLQDGKYKKVGSEEEESSHFVLITATNKDLIEEINKGNFREDLYWRINRVVMNLPAIKNRKNHKKIIEEVIRKELEKQSKFFSKQGYKINLKVNKKVINKISKMKLKGNFRELQKIIREALLNNILKKSLIEVTLKDDDFTFTELTIGNNKESFKELVYKISEKLYSDKYKSCKSKEPEMCSFKSDYHDIGRIINYEIIKIIMEREGLNQKEVAKKLDISEKSVGELKKTHKKYIE